MGDVSFVNNLPPGDYDLTITDGNGCETVFIGTVRRRQTCVLVNEYILSCHRSDPNALLSTRVLVARDELNTTSPALGDRRVMLQKYRNMQFKPRLLVV